MEPAFNDDDPTVGRPARNVVRYIFVSDASPTSQTSRFHSERVPKVGWRLIAANNRELGRSARTFSTLVECIDAATALRENHSSLMQALNLDAGRGGWGWSVSLNGAITATSARAYKRRIECARALAQFCAAIASVHADGSEIRLLGSYSLRARVDLSNATPDPYLGQPERCVTYVQRAATAPDVEPAT